MKKVVLALITVVFCCTAFAVTAEKKPNENSPQKPLSHYLAMATANTVNRLKTVEAFTKWMSYKLSDQELKDLKKFLQANGLKPSMKFPKMTAENNKVCFEKNDCMVYSDDSVSKDGVVFRVENKPFGKLLGDICSKISCGGKVANMSLIPEAHAGFGGLWGPLIGATAGYLIAGPGYKAIGAVAGAAIGWVGSQFLREENRYACGGNCNVSCKNDNYYIEPRGNYNGYLDQQRPPYEIRRDVHYRSYSQYQTPCSYEGEHNGVTDLQYALNNPPVQQFCGNQCAVSQQYDPNYRYSPGEAIPGQPNPNYAPAVITDKDQVPTGRKAASEEKNKGSGK